VGVAGPAGAGVIVENIDEAAVTPGAITVCGKSGVLRPAATGVGSGGEVFRWIAHIINPITPTAMMSVHQFDFKVAPSPVNLFIIQLDYTRQAVFGQLKKPL
jgi:hypothetical protein